MKKINYAIVKMIVPLIILGLISLILPTPTLVKIITMLTFLVIYLLQKEYFTLSFYYYGIGNPNMRSTSHVYSYGSSDKNMSFLVQCKNKLLFITEAIKKEKITPETQEILDSYTEEQLFFEIKILNLKIFSGDIPLYLILHYLPLSVDGYTRCIEKAIMEIFEKDKSLLENDNIVKSGILFDKINQMFNYNLNNTNFQQAMLSDLPEFITLKKNISQQNIKIPTLENKIELEDTLNKIWEEEKTKREIDNTPEPVEEDTSWKM